MRVDEQLVSDVCFVVALQSCSLRLIWREEEETWSKARFYFRLLTAATPVVHLTAS